MQQGSTNTDFPSAIVLANGFPVIAGATYANFPGMTLAGGNDAIVVKYNLDGTVAAMTTFATTDWDSIWASTIDDSANIYLVGHTTWDLNGTNAGAGSWTNDVFIAKVDSNLNQVWLIQTGTTTNDYGYAVALDSSGKVIVGGSSAGTWPDQTQLGDNDAFIMQYDSHGNRQWVIQFGSAGDDYVYGIAVDTVDSIDDIYATGVSAGSFEGHTSSGSNDFFLIKVSSTGTKDWSVLVGASSTSSSDEAFAVVVDSARNVYVSGYTSDQLPGATSLGGHDGFLVKYDKDGVQQWLIQIGSAGLDYAYGLTIDANDYLYVALQTTGTIGATNLGGNDIAVMQVNTASSIEWTEQFGTSSSEYLRKGCGSFMAVDSNGDLFITGETDGAFSGYSNQGGNDWFLYKVEAKSTTTSSSSTTSSVTSTSSATSSTTSSATRSSSKTSSATSTSSSSTGSVTSTSTSSSSTASHTTSSSSTSSSSVTTRTTTSATGSSSTTISSSTSSTSTSCTSSSSSTASTKTTTSTTSSITNTSTSATVTTTSSTLTETTLTSTSTSQTHTTSTTSATRTTSTTRATSTTATKTSSSTWTGTDTRTSATTTEEVPQEITPAELEALEAQRKEEAKQAVAAIEAAETAAVMEAFTEIFNGNGANRSDTPPGVLGEAVVKTDAGPVKVAALSVEALAEAGEPASISAGKDSSAAVEVDAGLLGEVAAAAGGEVVLLGLAELRGKAAESLQSDNVLAEDSGARRLASALRSRPLSINFRRTDGTKIAVTNLQQPMKFVLEVDDPNATCAFWDENLAKWSNEGVDTLPSESPGTLACSTRHLSIFGGVVSVVLKNVVVALECSTFSTLMDAKAFKMLGRPDWLGRSSGVLNICIIAVSALGLCLSGLADWRARKIIPWAATESLLMRVKEAPKRKDEGEEDAKDTEEDAEEVDDMEGDEEEATEKTESKKKRHKSEDENKKDNAAGGDWELPSMFRALRGLVEALLDTLSQATGGANFVDEIKEVVSNAETGTINRSIGMIQSHRSGACQATISVVKTGMDEVQKDSGGVRPSPAGEANPGLPTRASRVRASIREMVEVAGRVRNSAMAKVNAFLGNAQQNGTGAATSFLQRGFLCRFALLFPAAHNWLKLRQMSVLIPYSVRVALIAMKVISAEALSALFFSSSAPTPDSDPKCSPPSDDFERTVQSVTVGFVTAFLGDGIIFILFMVQRKSVVRRTEWTEARKARQRCCWSFRTCVFWVISFLYIIACNIYTWLFLANVREEDAAKWLDGVLWTLFQDLILKPLLVALILTTMSSLLLCCRPSLKRKIQAQWEEVDDEDDQGKQDDQDDSEAELEESHVSISHLSGEPEVEEIEEEAHARVGIDASKNGQMDFHGILPGMVA